MNLADADDAPVHRVGPLRAQRGRRGEAGASLVEFALVLPVFLMLVLGMMTGGLTYSRKLSIAQGVREGARYGATLPFTPATPSTWLDKVATVTRSSSDGELAATKPGQFLCVAYIDGAGVGTRRQETGGSVTTGSGSCIADDGRSGEARVQVVASRSSTLEALLFSRTLVLDSHAVARFESP
jgi:Flp pilus assembly protein TadG